MSDSKAPEPSPEEQTGISEASRDDLQAVLQQAVVLQRAGRNPEAIGLYREVLARQPEHLEAWSNLAVALRANGQRDAALAASRRALELRPDDPNLLSNLGNALRDLAEFEEALALHRRAVARKPSSAVAHHNLAISLKAAGDLPKALAELDEACRLAPDLPRLRVDRALVRLTAGEWEHAWPDYELRFELPEMKKNRFEGERWQGASFPGRKLLIHAEQGLGDAIFCARFLPEVKRRGGEVWLECQPTLRRLFEGLACIDRLVQPHSASEAADLHCGLMSLPGLFETTAETVPPPSRFPLESRLTSEQDACLARAGDRFRVGILWSGSVTYRGNRLRSAPMQAFLSLSAVPGIQFFSLQSGPPRELLLRSGAEPMVIDASGVLGDFADTATFVAALDLVITTDSAIAHLTASLGRPVWVILGPDPYWTFGREGSSTPWYPEMRLFRSQGLYGWDGAFDAARRQLLSALDTWRSGGWPARSRLR